MNKLILMWLREYVNKDDYEIREIRTQVQGVRATEFSLHIDFKDSPSLITSHTVVGREMASLWNFIMGTETE